MIFLIKCNNCGKVFDIVCKFCDMYGGNGIVDEFYIMCYMINFEIVNMYEGIYDIYGLILGCV